MSNLAPPIMRDGFAYQGQLFADAGNHNRHPRASKAEIRALLLPKKPETGQKDQVGHWYVAQLKHYGLPHTKDKNAAKLRLLNAINTGTLKVPADVKQLEADLKKEYAAANRNAKEAGLKPKDAAPNPTSTPARKKKGKAPTDKTAATPATPARTRRAKASAPDITPVTPARKRRRNGEDSPEPSAGPAPSEKTKPAEPPAKRKKEPAKKTPATPNARSVATPQKNNTVASTEEQATSAFDDKKGVYYLTILATTTQLAVPAADPKSHKMLLCPDGDELWGSYSFGPFSGVMRIDTTSLNGISGFTWRGTDSSDPSRVKFATGLGKLNFVDSRRIDGSFFSLGQHRTRFEGKLQAGVRQCPRDALSFQHEWDDYTHSNKWYGSPPARVPAGGGLLSGSFSRSSTRDASQSNEPHHSPVDSHQDTSSMDEQDVAKEPVVQMSNPGPSFAKGVEDKTLKENDSIKETTSIKENENIKKEPDLQWHDAQPAPVNELARQGSHIQSMNNFYNNSVRSGPEISDIGQITGVYDMQCPAIEDDFLESQNNLKMYLCRDARSSITWGSFAWGPFKGVIKMNPGPTAYSPTTVALKWRARDEQNGDARFGGGCHGEMEFSEPGSIAGKLLGLYGGTMEFWGKRRAGPRNCGYALHQFEQEWDSYPSDADGEPEESGSEDQLYDRHGKLNPRGRYVDLLKKSQSE
ncbi:uncharacterized protein BKCO1_8700011 [Diplodia corticola]|uniref:Uncharacterized protein n=1 Tax=Diplodia corticola TaxID=236234 RepID=A0A1J9QK14_9PEZI|nr:uncharacterized protein BKCO1_8700011 [Diplodia corticola]OJD29214.1 hypothetical protein BKCO1_8700011 [Diplodia corticola]